MSAGREFPFFRHQGFTLIEVVFVMVILGIIASIGSSFVVSAVNGYQSTKARVELANRGRLALEQMSRQIRMAVPNSVRVSDSGQCVEFMPVAASAHYLGELADMENQLTPASSVATVPFAIDFGIPTHVVVAPFYSEEIYSSASPSARVGLGTLDEPLISQVMFSSSHQFIRNSVSKRFYLGSSPIRFCLVDDRLLSFLDYGLSTAAMGDDHPGGRAALMAENVSTTARAFKLNPGSEVRNAALTIDLRFASGEEQLDLAQEVFIRNVP